MLTPHDQILAIIEVTTHSVIFVLGICLVTARGIKQWHSIATPILTLSAYRIAINALHLIERDVEDPRGLPTLLREMVPGNLLLMCMASVVQTVLEQRGRMPDFRNLAILRLFLMATTLCVGVQIIRQETSADPSKWRLLDIAMTISAGCTIANIWLAVRTRRNVKRGILMGEKPVVTVDQVALAAVGLISAPAVAVKMVSLIAMRTVKCEMMSSATLGFYIDVYAEASTLLMCLAASLFPKLVARAFPVGDRAQMVQYVIVEKQLIAVDDDLEKLDEKIGMNEKEGNWTG